MPKNKGKGGNKHRKGKKNNHEFKHELIFKEDSQEYAQALRMLGNGRLEAYCFDGVKRLCHIRGQMRKKVWINKDDFILVSLRDFQDSKADVIHKYNMEEARLLQSYGEIPDTIDLATKESTQEDDIVFTTEGNEEQEELMIQPEINDLPSSEDDDIDLDDL